MKGLRAQYTMLVVERHNCTFIEMVRSMWSYNTIPLSLEMHALKITAYLLLLNWVPSKTVPKTPYELWIRGKPNLWNLHLWGCLVEIRIYNTCEKKLHARFVNFYFINYPKKIRRIQIYCPIHSTRIVNCSNVHWEWSI